MTPAEGYESTAVSVTTLEAPKEALKALEKGRKALLKTRNLVEAEEQLEEAVRLHPRFAEAWTLLGLTRMSLDKSDSAIAAFEKSIESDPMYGAPYSPLAKTLIGRSDYRRALEVADRGVSLNPGDSGLKYALTLSAFALEENETAERWARQLYDAGEADYYPSVIYVLAAGARDAGRPDQAMRLFKEYLNGPGATPRLRALAEDGLKQTLLQSAEVEARTLTPEASGESIPPVEIVSPSKQ